MRILLAESDITFSNRLKKMLDNNGNTVDRVFNGIDCLSLAESDVYDVIIVDALLSNRGMEILIKMRENKVQTPIMYLAATRDVSERVEALDAGADECMAKPFAPTEFAARIRAMARRKPMQLQFGIMSFGDITLNLNTNEMLCNEHLIHLGVKEFQIMKLLIAGGQNALSKETLTEKVWGIDSEAEYNNTEVYISFLRKKLKKLNSSVTIHTIRGIGYVLSSI